MQTQFAKTMVRSLKLMTLVVLSHADLLDERRSKQTPFSHDQRTCADDTATMLQSRITLKEPMNALGTKVAATTGRDCNETMGAGRFGEGYRGCQTKTVSGKTCQKWTSQAPHRHSRTPANYPSGGLGDQNYCRNPDKAWGIWCYTIDPHTRWEYCNPVPQPGHGTYCVRVTTGSAPDWCKGDLNIKVDTGSGYDDLSTGYYHSLSTLVAEKCFSSPVMGVKIHAPTTDAWGGSITYSSDGGKTFAAKTFPPYKCLNCTQPGKSTSKIGVDGSPDDGTWGDFAGCTDYDTCEIVDTTPPRNPPTRAPPPAPTTTVTLAPTIAVTPAPTTSVTLAPTLAPTIAVTLAPTIAVTLAPTIAVTPAPTTSVPLAPPLAPTTAVQPCDAMCAGLAPFMGWDRLCSANSGEIVGAPPCQGCSQCAVIQGQINR